MVKIVQEEANKVAQACSEAGQQEPYEYELVLARTDTGTRAFSIVQQHFLVNRKIVVERDTDLLTRDELKQHEEEVAAAILAELKTWIKYEYFSRRKKSTARKGTLWIANG